MEPAQGKLILFLHFYSNKYFKTQTTNNLALYLFFLFDALLPLLALFKYFYDLHKVQLDFTEADCADELEAALSVLEASLDFSNIPGHNEPPIPTFSISEIESTLQELASPSSDLTNSTSTIRSGESHTVPKLVPTRQPTPPRASPDPKLNPKIPDSPSVIPNKVPPKSPSSFTFSSSFEQTNKARSTPPSYQPPAPTSPVAPDSPKIRNKPPSFIPPVDLNEQSIDTEDQYMGQDDDGMTFRLLYITSISQ